MSVTNSEGIPLNQHGVVEGSVSRKIHANDDTDFDAHSHHHTIGDGPWQAASGAQVKALTELVAELISSGIPGATVPLTTSFPGIAGTYIWNHGLGRKVIAQVYDSTMKQIHCGMVENTVNQIQIFLKGSVSFPVTVIIF